jgi:hypothetical protein
MLQARKRLKRVQNYSLSLIPVAVLTLVISLSVVPSPSPAATAMPKPVRELMAMTFKSSPAHHSKRAPAVHGAAQPSRGPTADAGLTDFTNHPTPSDGYVVSLIHQDFPANAWHDAEAVAWCESKFRTTDIGFDSNGTHDRGLFQLNDGGTEQYLMAMIGENPKNLNLAFNPVLNVRAAALLYRRDGWSQWSCETAI